LAGIMQESHLQKMEEHIRVGTIAVQVVTLSPKSDNILE
jgi:hypothetical protein